MARRETELKFLLEPQALAALRAELFAEAPAHELVSTYYDTADRALATAGLALRLRYGQGGWVQTIKAHGPLDRYEDEVAVEEEALRPERLLEAPGGQGLGSPGELRPVCRVAAFRRTLVRQHGAAEIEWALDEGVVSAGALGSELREVELELKSGDPADLFAAARELAARPGVLLSLISKAERGFQLAEHGREALYHFRPPALAPEATVRQGFEAAALGALGQVCANVWRLRAGDEAEAVHQARIALRRLRVALGAFRPLVEDETFGHMQGELKRLTALFADARSLDVFALPEPEEGAEAGADALRLALNQARARARARTREGLVDPALGAALLDLAAWVAAGPWTAGPKAESLGEAPLAPFAADAIRRRRRQLLRKARRLDWVKASPRHKLRIQAKKMRYLLDTFAMGEAGKSPFVKRLKRLQADLGELNDIATARQTAELAVDGASAAAGLAAGLAVAARRAEAPRLIGKARKAARRLRRAPLD